MQYGDYIPVKPITRLLGRENPVDIIIPYYGEYDKILELCKSIFRV